MSKYRQKPIVIDAEQFNYHPKDPRGAKYGAKTGDMFMELPIWVDQQGYHLVLQTHECELRVNPGDWVIAGENGDRQRCKDSIFKQTYEPVTEL